jgi:hypothetical protein
MKKAFIAAALVFQHADSVGYAKKARSHHRRAPNTSDETVTQLATMEKPKPLLVLRLAYSGSSWFTQMISEQNDTYITREANWVMGGTNREKVERMTAGQIASYVLKAMVVPSGDLLHANEPQVFDYSDLDSAKKPEMTMNLFQHQHLQSAYARAGNPQVMRCLSSLGQRCHVKYLGLTMDPVGTGLDTHGEEVFRQVSESYPNLPVVIYRRSNLVKHAIASGGLNPDDKPKLGVHMDPTKFLAKVRESQAHDRKLTQSAKYFKRTMLVQYEELVLHPVDVMKDTLLFLGMPFDAEYTRQLSQRGGKKTPEDMRTVFSNFDELYWTLFEKSPCLASQMRSTKVEVFRSPCPDI